MHSKSNESRKAKTSYNLERIEYHSRKIDLTHECVLLIHHQKDLILRTQIYGLLQIAEIPVDMNKAASKFHKFVHAPT